ncbi:MAG: DUF4430 domain-containing protein [Candidatus Nomurabacteria bacterium]|nr:DUF4430 domain-containing protein [Candidatus Nomurabacteria bacterium]
MKNKKIIIIVGLIISLIIIFLIIHPSVLRTPPLSRGGINTEIVPKALSEKNVKVFLTVQEKKYETEVKESGTVFEVMKKIQDESSSANPFSFKYTENPNLGVFINEINGLKGGGDGYWIYYVNGIEANVGISNYKIKNGDIISWKYEK